MKKQNKQIVVKKHPQEIANPVVLPQIPAEDPVQTSAKKLRDPRLPAIGSIISKTYHGEPLEVKVLENGFEYKGKVYKSISRVAMEIVHRSISGYVFFGLQNGSL